MKVRVRTSGGDPKEKRKPTASELAEANRIAKDFAVRRNLIIGENAHVGNQIPQYVEAGTGRVLTKNDAISPMGKLSNKVPLGIQELEWDAKANLPYYIDPQTGDTQYVAKELFYSPRFRRNKIPITSISNPLGNL
jgi:hypothetical protein